MYNTDLPRRADLPTSAQLRRSTLIAAASALAILATIVLPSEYGVDPTGIGRMVGLTQMGEIKVQLAAEAAADTSAPAFEPATAAVAPPDDPSVAQRLDAIEALLRAAPQEPAVEPAQPAVAAALDASPVPESPAGRSDQVSFTLTPGQGAEIKLVMRQGARVSFAWESLGAPINFDTHGDGSGQSTSYEKGRNVVSDDGVLEAVFDGNHGWFWRNRSDVPATVTLRTNGDYMELKRVS